METSIRVFLVSTTALFVCGMFIVFGPVDAVGQGAAKKSSESSTQEIIAAKSMAQNGSRKIMDGATMLRESMKIMKQGNDKGKATAMMNNAIQIMAEGEKMVAEAQEMAEKNPSVKAQMKPIISSCLKMMGGCILMRKGAGMMDKNESDLAWAEQTVAKGLKRSKEAARRIEWGGSMERNR